MKKILTKCPVCDSKLKVAKYKCSKCDVTINGDFPQSSIATLSPEQAEFVKVFLSVHGNIRDVERIMGISYPTVKSRLEQINKSLGLISTRKEETKKVENRTNVLSELEKGDINVEEALNRLRKEK